MVSKVIILQSHKQTDVSNNITTTTNLHNPVSNDDITGSL